MIKSIGVIGNGFVGSALSFGFSPHMKVYIHDKNPKISVNSLDTTVNESDIIFVCVPTPMNEDGSINLSHIHNVCKKISIVNNRKDNIVVIKSTVVPGTCDLLREIYPSLNIVFNPEFLTERKARFDFLNQTRIILGGSAELTSKVEQLYKIIFHSPRIIHTDYKTGEFIKYFANVFFAVKVSFANEMKLICDAVGVNWEEALAGFVSDGRIADSHLNVPGPDGKRGFGGTCFPKDICAFINFAKKTGIDANVVEGAWKTNLQVRTEKDWEKLTGRAVTKGDKNE